MFLKEFEARALFRKYDIPVARSILLYENSGMEKSAEYFLDEKPDAEEFVLKAQLLSGKRGKSGGVLFAKRDEILPRLRELFSQRIHDEPVDEILVQEKLEIRRELYLSVTIDRFLRCPVLVFSAEGGMEIEEMAERSPEKIVEIPFGTDGMFDEQELPEQFRSEIAPIGRKLYKLLMEEEALVAEINPLILTTNHELAAADAKVIIDNNALSRHPEYDHKSVRGHSKLELQAREHDLAYVELDGDIAVIGNGAGLVMATLDAVDAYGGKPANFCDVGGGASEKGVQKAMEIVLQKSSVKALFLNVFGGITHCDEVASGVIASVRSNKVELPMVIRMVGTNEEKAHEMFRAAGFDVYRSFEEAAQKVASLPS